MISDVATDVEKTKEKPVENLPAKPTEKQAVKPAEKPAVASPAKLSTNAKPTEKSAATTPATLKSSAKVKPVEKPASPVAKQATNAKLPLNVKSANQSEKPSAQSPLPKPVQKRKEPENQPPLQDTEANKIQINLKKFKKAEVEYPEDTGGDFPGLILWIGVRKNSKWERSLFCILMESFKMSKYGDLIIEESEETVWGRKEPLKKCVMKYNRKVLAVGLGESKTEAKNSASLQVLRQLRKHCYTIQAKESYFKEGKATPYDFNPDPSKAHLYRLAKKENLKDRASVIKFVDDFSKNVTDEEVIFGDDFTYEEREAILDHCRKINLNYRLIKCQSVSRNMHTHIALYHQQPLPTIKAALIKEGGENDMYRLISPGGKVTNQANDKWRKQTRKQLTLHELKDELIKSGGEDDNYRLILPGKLPESMKFYICEDNCHSDEPEKMESYCEGDDAAEESEIGLVTSEESESDEDSDIALVCSKETKPEITSSRQFKSNTCTTRAKGATSKTDNEEEDSSKLESPEVIKVPQKMPEVITICDSGGSTEEEEKEGRREDPMLSLISRASSFLAKIKSEFPNIPNKRKNQFKLEKFKKWR